MRHINILKKLLYLNRHHISPDMDTSLEELCKVYGGHIDEHLNDSSLSWRIPPGYKVVKAELRDNKGNLICSHKDNPMHLWAYSPSFSGHIDYSELKKKIFVDFDRPKAILYHFRNQYRSWKTVWGFSLNVEQYSKLDKKGKFYVEIQTEFYKAPLKQFLLNKPSHKNNLILVAHLDHYFQLNDGLGSAILNNEIVSELKDKLDNINLCSLNSIEIIGSVYFLNKYKLNSSNTICAISTNGLTIDSNLIFQLSGKKESTVNKLIELYYLLYQPDSKLCQFREGWGNDEIAFEVPGVSIPCVSLHRGPHYNYHTNLDDFSCYSESSFNQSKNMIKNIILNLDKNYSIEVKNWKGLLCLSNPDINLYIEGSKISGVNQKSNIEELSFINELMPNEVKYLKANIEKLKSFNNRFQSHLSHYAEVTIIDLAYEFSLPVTFVKCYLEVLRDKGFISLIYKN